MLQSNVTNLNIKMYSTDSEQQYNQEWQKKKLKSREEGGITIVCYLISSAGVGGSVAWLPSRITGFLARLTNSMHFCTWFVMKEKKNSGFFLLILYCTVIFLTK